MRTTPGLRCLLLLALLAPLPLRAQVIDPPRPDGSSVLAYAKWGALGAAVTAGVIGFAAHSDADGLFDDLEAICEDDPVRCRVDDNGAYIDAELESRFQDVLDADGRVRTALIVSQVAVAAAVAMFLLDLDGGDDPDNVPYDPERGFGLRNNPSDGRAELVYVVPLGRR
jgi:hypothetical protein